MTEFFLHGGTLALAWFLLIDVSMSAAIAIGARALATRGAASDSATFWFAARVWPGAAAAAFVGVVFVPSYWKYEPRDFVEGFDITLTVMAIGAAVLVGVAASRGIGAWRRATRRTRLWMRTARRLALPDTRIPTWEIDAEAPLMALVGVLRPRLLVTRGLVQALSPDELAASVAHEDGHWHAFDNLKRLLMRAAPDVLTFTRAARTIERRWASAAERAADRVAVGRSPAARCALASALVKVARLTPPAAAQAPPRCEPISTLTDGGEIASRVEHLLTDAAPPRPRWSPLGWTALLSTAAGVAVGYAPVLRLVHSATEVLVRTLP
jgi:Peptidase family M48